MNDTRQKESSIGEKQNHRQTVAAVAAVTTTRPMLLETPSDTPMNSCHKNVGDIVDRHKDLISRLSRPLFTSDPPTSNCHATTNDNKNKNKGDGNERNERNNVTAAAAAAAATHTMNEKQYKSQTRKTARVSIGTADMAFDGNALGDGNNSGIASPIEEVQASSEEEEDTPIRKKQKKFGDEERYTMPFNDSAPSIWKDTADDVSTILLLEDDSTSLEETFSRLDKWTKELSALKEKLEDARLQNAILLNKLCEIGATREQYDG